MSAYQILVASVALSTLCFFAVIYLGYKLYIIQNDTKLVLGQLKNSFDIANQYIASSVTLSSATLLTSGSELNEPISELKPFNANASVKQLTKEEIENFRKQNQLSVGSSHEDNNLEKEVAEARYEVIELYNRGYLNDEMFDKVEELGYIEVLRIYKDAAIINPHIPTNGLEKKSVDPDPLETSEVSNETEEFLFKTVDLRFNITLKSKLGSIALEDIDVTPIEVSAKGDIVSNTEVIGESLATVIDINNKSSFLSYPRLREVKNAEDYK